MTKKNKSLVEMLKDGKKESEHIILCEDGKYRWFYDVNLFKHYFIYFIIFKIFFFILLAAFIVGILFNIGKDNFFSAKFIGYLKGYGIALLVMIGVTLLGYYLYALIMGGKYSVLFELDSKGINHQQVNLQASKAKKIAAATFIVGLLSNNLTTMGIGISSGKTSMYTEFSHTRKIKINKKANLIKLTEGLYHNQVYVYKEDFEFIYNYILKNCPNIK